MIIKYVLTNTSFKKNIKINFHIFIVIIGYIRVVEKIQYLRGRLYDCVLKSA